MTQADLDVLAGFAEVWERVSGERIPSPQSASVTLGEVLEGLYGHWQGCAALAVWAVGMHRKRLLGLVSEAEALFRRVQTECFLESGDIFQGELVMNFASYTPYNLRKVCKNAMELAERLQKGQETCSVSVGNAVEMLVSHGEALKELLQECLR